MDGKFIRSALAGPSALTGTRCSGCGALAVSREPRLLALFERAHVCLGLSRGGAYRRKPAHSVKSLPEARDSATGRSR